MEACLTCLWPKAFSQLILDPLPHPWQWLGIVRVMAIIDRMFQLTQKRLDGTITKEEFNELETWYAGVVARERAKTDKAAAKLKKSPFVHTEETKQRISDSLRKMFDKRKKDELPPQ